MAVRNALRRLVHVTRGKWGIAAAATALAVFAVIWALPRRTPYLVPVAGNTDWPQQQAPPTREIVWQPPSEIEWTAADAAANGQTNQQPLATPRFAAHGTLLYFSRRSESGQADIWESRRVPGGWSDPQPVPVINSTANDFGPLLDRQQRHLYFYSDRAGGLGGFDLYVSHRSERGTWQPPVNLGPQINSSADEYDPAISPDHTQLFFASDRVERLEHPENPRSIETAWTVTIRVRRRAATFDLFRSARADTADPWLAAERLPIVNQPRVNDGAPFVSPNGAYLYFASDRRARPDEPVNLDLYRARISGGTLAPPENLGTSLNTAAHETEPGLSTEGYTLVFASDRDGQDRLFVSQAEEIARVNRWDTSHLSGLGRLWWQSLLITLLIMSIIALITWYRGTLWERAYASRFFIGSVAVHLLVLLILAAWTLPKVVEMIVAEVNQSDPISDSLLESERQSHEDGRESYEKVADLDAPQQQVPDQVRQVTQPSTVPQAAVKPFPSLPIPRNRPVANVNPQPQSVTVTNTPPELRPLTRRTTGPRQQTLAEASEPAVTLPAPVEPATERPVQPRTVSLPRRQALLESLPMNRTSETSAPPVLQPSQSTNMAVIKPADVPTTSTAVKSPQPRAVASVNRQPAVDPGAAELPPQETPNAVPDPAAVKTVIDRQTTSGTVTPTATPVQLPPRQRQPSPMPLAATPISTPSSRSTNLSLQSPLKRTPQSKPTRGLPILEETLPELPVTVRDAKALQVKKRQAPVPRSVISVPEPGIQSTAANDTAPLEPTRPSQTQLERSEVNPTGTPTPPVPLPVARQAAIASRTLTTSQLDEPTPTIAAGSQIPQLPGVSVAETVSPQKASSQIANTTLEPPTRPDPSLPFGPRRTALKSTAVQITPGPERDVPVTPLNRAATSPAQLAVSRLADTPPLNTLKADQPAAESPLDATEIALARTRMDRAVPTRPPSEVAGAPFPSRKPRVVGSLAERSNEAPPSFGKRVSLLNRRPARAPRVAFAKDKVGLKSLLVLRQGNVRQEYIEILGGSDKTERAVDLGLKWLADHQDPEGNWSLDNFHKNCQGKHANCPHAGSVKSDTAATGFALLPFLAAGHTHQQGAYRKSVAAAAEWLVAHQQKNGDLFVPGNKHHWMYSHGVASMALCELYGMTGDDELKQPAQTSLDFIVASQHKPSGGWRYQPNEAADTSVVGWQLMALKSGEMAGLSVSAETFQHIGRWLKSVEGNQPVGGLFGYTNRSPKVTMTAEGLLCLQFMGLERNDPRMRAGADYLLKNLPQKDQRNTSYAWYYGSQVMYHMQGEYWNAWNAALRDILVESQEQKGTTAGTWQPRDQWEKSGGRLYASSMKLLILEVYYRHLPLYQHLSQ